MNREEYFNLLKQAFVSPLEAKLIGAGIGVSGGIIGGLNAYKHIKPGKTGVSEMEADIHAEEERHRIQGKEPPDKKSEKSLASWAKKNPKLLSLLAAAGLGSATGYGAWSLLKSVSKLGSLEDLNKEAGIRSSAINQIRNVLNKGGVSSPKLTGTLPKVKGTKV